MKTPYELYLENPQAVHAAARRARSIALSNLLRKLFVAASRRAGAPAPALPRHA